MLTRAFGKTGWTTSVVGQGTWNIGNQWGEMDDATAWRIVRTAFDHGMTLFDAAESYGIPNGTSEERLGLALAGIRHRVVLVTKIGHWGLRTGQGVPHTTPDMIRLCAHACLHRLRTEWVDVMLCHEADIEDPGVFIEAFETLKRRGRIRVYGISTDRLDVLQRFHETAPSGCAAVEVDYSLLNLAPEADLLPYCQAQGIAVIIRGPLHRGRLSGKYTADTRFTDTVRRRWHESPEAQAAFEAKMARVAKLEAAVQAGEALPTLALRYTLSHPAVTVAIPGATRPEQAVANAAAGERELTEEEKARLLAALA
ncbi:MAG: aldo/keto reductase [bacterium]